MFTGTVEVNVAEFLATTEVGYATFNYFFTLMHVMGLVAFGFGILFKLFAYAEERWRA